MKRQRFAPSHALLSVCFSGYNETEWTPAAGWLSATGLPVTDDANKAPSFPASAARAFLRGVPVAAQCEEVNAVVCALDFTPMHGPGFQTVLTGRFSYAQCARVAAYLTRGWRTGSLFTRDGKTLRGKEACAYLRAYAKRLDSRD